MLEIHLLVQQCASRAESCCFCSNAYREMFKRTIGKRQRYGKAHPDEGTRERLVRSKET